jgi:putative oxidoreductase
MSTLCSLTLLLGRLCVSTLFILAGVGKLLDYEGTYQYMHSMGMLVIPFFLIGAAAVEIFGGLSLLLGFKTRIGATALLLFLIPVTVIFHNFWMVEDLAARQMQLVEFLKNLAIFGGLLYILSAGPGKISLDAGCRSCETQT